MKSFYGNDEKELLEDFAQLLRKLKPSMLLCGHNGKEFDFPYLSRRMIINGIELPPQLDNSQKKPWEVLHLGPAGQNWYGRSTKRLDGTTPEGAEGRIKQVTEIWTERRKRESKGLDPFAPERTG